MKEVANPETIGWLVALRWSGLCLGSAAVVWALGKWAKRSSQRQSDLHRGETVNDVLEAFHVTESERKDVAVALDAAIASGKGALPLALAPIFRIECVYETMSSGKGMYDRNLLVYHRSDTGVEKLLTIKREYAWAHLPSSVRAVFTRERGKRVIELLYAKEGA